MSYSPGSTPSVDAESVATTIQDDKPTITANQMTSGQQASQISPTDSATATTDADVLLVVNQSVPSISQPLIHPPSSPSTPTQLTRHTNTSHLLPDPIPIHSLQPLPLQLGGHPNLFSTDPTGSLIIKKSNPREIAFYIYLRSLSHELSLEATERANQVLWESHGLGRAIVTGKGLWDKAGVGLWDVQEKVVGVGLGAGQVIGSAGAAMGRQVGELAGGTKGRLRALTSPSEWGRGTPSSEDTAALITPETISPVDSTAQTTSNRLSSLFSFDKLPKLPISKSGGFTFPSFGGTTSASSPPDADQDDTRIGLEPEEEHGINENAGRKDPDEVLQLDDGEPTKMSGTNSDQDQPGEGRKRAEQLLKEMKGIKLSKGKGKERTPSMSTIGSGSGLPLTPATSKGSIGGEDSMTVTAEQIIPEPSSKIETEHKSPPAVTSDQSIGLKPAPVALAETPMEEPATSKETDQRVLLAKLIPFLPKFHGTLSEEGTGVGSGGSGGGASGSESVVLQNILSSFTHPAAADIKLGTILYDDTAVLSEEKKAKMVKKAVETTSATMGMKFSGFQTWNDITQEAVTSPREYGTSLTADRLPEAIAKYTPIDVVSSKGPISPNKHRKNVIRVLSALSGTLTALRAVVTDLDIRFVGASILIVYEGSPTLLDKAWRAADRGEVSGDGLDLPAKEEEDEEEIRQPPTDTVSKAAKALRLSLTKPTNGPSIEDRLTEDAAEFEMDTSLTGFAFIDGDRSPAGSGRNTPGHMTPDVEHDGEAHELQKSPFQVRLIDFAHTRLAPGEGKDEGFLKGLTTLIDLLKGRVAELNRG